MTDPKEALIERLRKASKPGYGLETSMSEEERTAYWADIAISLRLMCAEAAGALEGAVTALKPFAKLGNIILAEAPAEAKTIVGFTSASGERFSMQLDYFRAAIAALEKESA
jgi:hypothetical protein